MDKKTKVLVVVALAIIIVLLVLRLALGKNQISHHEETGTPSSGSERPITYFDDSKMITLTDDNYVEQVKDYKGIVVIEFSASWVEECKQQDAIMCELSNEMDHIKFARVDKDEAVELSKFFAIDILPAIVVMQDGSIKSKTIGVVPASKIKDLINY